MKNIYVLEDSPVVGQLLRYHLETEFACEVTYFCSKEQLMAAMKNRPDIVILDYFLEEKKVNGLSVLKQLKSVYTNVHVIVFSGQHELSTVIELLNNGAVDYIDKNGETFLEDLSESIHSLLLFDETQLKITHAKNGFLTERKRFLSTGLITLLFLSIMGLINGLL